jgi:hypothetical protein
VALMTIRLIRNPQTGKQTVVVKLDSDADALPHEHEHLHKDLVEKLVGKGLKLEDLGEVIIERDGDVKPVSEPVREPIPERKTHTQSHFCPAL